MYLWITLSVLKLWIKFTSSLAGIVLNGVFYSPKLIMNCITKLKIHATHGKSSEKLRGHFKIHYSACAKQT